MSEKNVPEMLLKHNLKTLRLPTMRNRPANPIYKLFARRSTMPA